MFRWRRTEKPMKSSGWGTWIRTKIDGVRVRSSTVELFPNRRGQWAASSWQAPWARDGRLVAYSAPRSSLRTHLKKRGGVEQRRAPTPRIVRPGCCHDACRPQLADQGVPARQSRGCCMCPCAHGSRTAAFRLDGRGHGMMPTADYFALHGASAGETARWAWPGDPAPD
jgi:hypothetical protein